MGIYFSPRVPHTCCFQSFLQPIWLGSWFGDRSCAPVEALWLQPVLESYPRPMQKTYPYTRTSTEASRYLLPLHVFLEVEPHSPVSGPEWLTEATLTALLMLRSMRCVIMYRVRGRWCCGGAARGYAGSFCVIPPALGGSGGDVGGGEHTSARFAGRSAVPGGNRSGLSRVRFPVGCWPRNSLKMYRHMYSYAQPRYAFLGTR